MCLYNWLVKLCVLITDIQSFWYTVSDASQGLVYRKRVTTVGREPPRAAGETNSFSGVHPHLGRSLRRGRAQSREPRGNLCVIGLWAWADYWNRNAPSQSRWWESGVCGSFSVFAATSKSVSEGEGDASPSRSDLMDDILMESPDGFVHKTPSHQIYAIYIWSELRPPSSVDAAAFHTMVKSDSEQRRGKIAICSRGDYAWLSDWTRSSRNTAAAAAALTSVFIALAKGRARQLSLLPVNN